MIRGRSTRFCVLMRRIMRQALARAGACLCFPVEGRRGWECRSGGIVHGFRLWWVGFCVTKSQALLPPAKGATRSPKTILRDGGKAAKVAGEFDEQRTSRPPRTLTTVYPRWCDDSTSRAKHQFQPPQVSGCEHRPTAGDWSSATKGCTMSEARTKRR